MPTRVSRAAPRGGTEHPAWHWQALGLLVQGVPLAEIAAAVGRSTRRVEHYVYSPWGREERRKLVEAAAEQARKHALDPLVKFQAAGARMADIMLDAAEQAEKPLHRAVIAEKNLALGGWAPVQKSVHLDLAATLRDRAGVTDEELVAFLHGGPAPAAVQAHLALPDAASHPAGDHGSDGTTRRRDDDDDEET